MDDMTIAQMQEMQRALNERYRGKWEPLIPKTGQEQLLWMIGEVGEVIDIIKKQKDGAIMNDSTTRAAFIEEMADVLMYFNDVLLCYGVSPEDIARVYRAKYERNLNRW